MDLSVLLHRTLLVSAKKKGKDVCTIISQAEDDSIEKLLQKRINLNLIINAENPCLEIFFYIHLLATL